MQAMHRHKVILQKKIEWGETHAMRFLCFYLCGLEYVHHKYGCEEAERVGHKVRNEVRPSKTLQLVARLRTVEAQQ